jgi:hypothetical protein
LAVRLKPTRPGLEIDTEAQAVHSGRIHDRREHQFFVYLKSKTWELPEEHISGMYTKKRKGDQIEIVYVGEDPVSEEECDMTLLWPTHPKTEHVDPYGTERCYTRSGSLPSREVYVLGDE